MCLFRKVCMPWCICGGQGTICGVWFFPSFHHVGPREGTRVVNLGTKYLYPLNHLAELLRNFSFLCVKNIPNPFYWLFGGFSATSAIGILWWYGNKKPFPKCICPLHPPTTPGLLPHTSQALILWFYSFPRPTLQLSPRSGNMWVCLSVPSTKCLTVLSVLLQMAIFRSFMSKYLLTINNTFAYL